MTHDNTPSLFGPSHVLDLTTHQPRSGKTVFTKELVAEIAAKSRAAPETTAQMRTMMIPSKDQNPNGLHVQYRLFKADMSETAPGDYFVLRLDDGCKDPAHTAACRKALMTYANEIEAHLPQLAADLRERYAP